MDQLLNVIALALFVLGGLLIVVGMIEACGNTCLSGALVGMIASVIVFVPLWLSAILLALYLASAMVYVAAVTILFYKDSGQLTLKDLFMITLASFIWPVFVVTGIGDLICDNRSRVGDFLEKIVLFKKGPE